MSKARAPFAPTFHPLPPLPSLIPLYVLEPIQKAFSRPTPIPPKEVSQWDFLADENEHIQIEKRDLEQQKQQAPNIVDPMDLDSEDAIPIFQDLPNSIPEPASDVDETSTKQQAQAHNIIDVNNGENNSNDSNFVCTVRKVTVGTVLFRAGRGPETHPTNLTTIPVCPSIGYNVFKQRYEEEKRTKQDMFLGKRRRYRCL